MSATFNDQVGKIPVLQQLKTHVSVERSFSYALLLFDRAIARIEALEAQLAERESTWLTAREAQWKRENPMGSTPLETLSFQQLEARFDDLSLTIEHDALLASLPLAGHIERDGHPRAVVFVADVRAALIALQKMEG